MKTLLVISPHSILDVITNSSTELFICDTDKTVQTVEEILAADPNVYGYEKPWVFSINEYREWRKNDRYRVEHWNEYSDKQRKEFWDNESPYSMLSGWFYDIEDAQDMMYLRKSYIEDGPRNGNSWDSSKNIYSKRLEDAEDKAAVITKLNVNDQNRWKVRYDARKAEIYKIYEEVEKQDEKPDWWVNPVSYHYTEQPIHELDGKIIILGDGDNSIPYDHFDWIENTFGARRYHLG